MQGNERSSVSNVKSFLQKHHNYSEAQAKALTEKHHEEIATAMRVGSFVYYPVDQILAAEGHECDEQCKEPEEGDDSE